MSQPERAALHNQLSGEIVKQIIKPMMESGASFSSRASSPECCSRFRQRSDGALPSAKSTFVN